MGTCGQGIGGWWGGRDSGDPGARIGAWGGPARIRSLQESLVAAGARTAAMWGRLWGPHACPCVREGSPQSPHEVCYGTGVVGGYRRYGNAEWVLYKKADGTWAVMAPGYALAAATAVVSGGNVMVTTGTLDGTLMAAGTTVSVNAALAGAAVELSTDGVAWASTIEAPAGTFRMRVTGPAAALEAARCRGLLAGVTSDRIKLSTNPPVKFTDLASAGLGNRMGDLRVWTLHDPTFFTGDFIQWDGGTRAGHRYETLNQSMAELTDGADLQGMTQILNMRLVLDGENLKRVW